MYRWSKLPVTIRASVIGAIITLAGSLFIAIITHKKTNTDQAYYSESISTVIPPKPQSRILNRDSLAIINNVKSYFEIDSIKVLKLNTIDLDNNGLNNEFIIVYQTHSKYTSFYDVFTLRESGLYNLYHDEFFTGFRDFDFIKVGHKKFLIKTWKSEGSGAYLYLEIYSYLDHTRLTKIYTFPDTLDTFQGKYLRFDNTIYLILSGKRYNLIIDSFNKVSLLPYTKRLNMKDMQNSEHILRFDEYNHKLNVLFDNKKVNFTKVDSKYISKDTVVLCINDICWIDDNSDIPTSLRYFLDSHFAFTFDLFSSLIAKQKGTFTYAFANEGYGDWYYIIFKINDEKLIDAL